MNVPKYRKFNVIKSNGLPEKFSKKKLINSLIHSGLSDPQSRKIAENVSHELVDGLKTKKIYNMTLKLVKKNSYVAGIHYSLKRSILELGPTGFFFEKFVAKYFHELGFEIQTGQLLRGQFVQHEVDVVAKKNNFQIFTECKFHNHEGYKNDIKVALYVKARWDDLKNGPEGKNLKTFFLASNTSFTLDALKYAQGTGLQLLGVNAPREDSFLEQIKRMRLYPITSLRKLNKFQKDFFLNEGIISVKNLIEAPSVLKKLPLSNAEKTLLLEEALFLIQN